MIQIDLTDTTVQLKAIVYSSQLKIIMDIKSWIQFSLRS